MELVVYADGTHGVPVHKCVAKSVRAEHVFPAANALPAARKKGIFHKKAATRPVQRTFRPPGCYCHSTVHTS